jgi:hypothetical protein
LQLDKFRQISCDWPFTSGVEEGILSLPHFSLLSTPNLPEVEMHSTVRPSALVISANETLAVTRRMILEAEGFAVTSAMSAEFDVRAVDGIKFTLLLFGHSVPARHKLAIAKIVESDSTIELFAHKPILHGVEHCPAFEPEKLVQLARVCRCRQMNVRVKRESA